MYVMILIALVTVCAKWWNVLQNEYECIVTRLNINTFISCKGLVSHISQHQRKLWLEHMISHCIAPIAQLRVKV